MKRLRRPQCRTGVSSLRRSRHARALGLSQTGNPPPEQFTSDTRAPPASIESTDPGECLTARRRSRTAAEGATSHTRSGPIPDPEAADTGERGCAGLSRPARLPPKEQVRGRRRRPGANLSGTKDSGSGADRPGAARRAALGRDVRSMLVSGASRRAFESRSSLPARRARGDARHAVVRTACAASADVRPAPPVTPTSPSAKAAPRRRRPRHPFPVIHVERPRSRWMVVPCNNTSQEISMRSASLPLSASPG